MIELHDYSRFTYFLLSFFIVINLLKLKSMYKYLIMDVICNLINLNKYYIL